jgi:hypothetical protein
MGTQIRQEGYTPYEWQTWFEYWAVLTEAWFQSTSWTGPNLGINTRALLRSKEPMLAALFLNDAYGSSP